MHSPLHGNLRLRANDCTPLSDRKRASYAAICTANRLVIASISNLWFFSTEPSALPSALSAVSGALPSLAYAAPLALSTALSTVPSDLPSLACATRLLL